MGACMPTYAAVCVYMSVYACVFVFHVCAGVVCLRVSVLGAIHLYRHARILKKKFHCLKIKTSKRMKGRSKCRCGLMVLGGNVFCLGLLSLRFR